MPNIDVGGGDYGSLYTGNTATGGSNTPTAGGGVLGFQGTGATGSGVGGAIQGIGNAVGDILTASGDQASAKEYTEAAVIALQNKQVEANSLITQTSAAARQLESIQGATTAQVGAAGFNTGTFVAGKGVVGGGTAGSLRAANQTNFNMNTSAMVANNYLQQSGYQQQATADEEAAAASNRAATGSYIGAGFSALSSIANVAMMAG